MTEYPAESARASQGVRPAGMRTPVFRVSVALVVLLALVVRLAYVTTAVVEFPIRGDASQYVLHAWNLVHRGEFSARMPEGAIVVHEDHRGPGYPLFIALAMVAAGHSDLPLREGPQGTVTLGYRSDSWMHWVYAMQIVLGTLSVLLAIAIARTWLSRTAAIVAGVFVALWPHLVVATGVLLSETVFGFTIALAMCMALRALSIRTLLSAILAGMCFGLAYLVNPVIALYVFFVAGLVWWVARIRVAALFLVAFGLFPAVWGFSTAQSVDDFKSRIVEPFVIGSWPEFYTAYNTRFTDATSAQIMSAYSVELRAFGRSFSEGLGAMRERMSTDRALYVRWYLLAKPFLLWDWVIQIGPGDFYTMETQNSPYDRNPIFRASASIFKTLNPFLFFLALAGCAEIAFRFFCRKKEALALLPAIAVAVLFGYVTLTYTVLQAEPRYSIPFKPFEILLSVAAFSCLWRIVESRRLLSASRRTRAA
jgi:4-amino-4-deoxy-L-arabinose transferase-like glycosyltransferase